MDDGDNKELNMHDIRLLPKNYPKVLYPKKRTASGKETANCDNSKIKIKTDLLADQSTEEELLILNEEPKEDITARIEALEAAKIKSEESSTRSSRSSLDQSCQGTLDSILDKLTSEEEMRQNLLSNVLKKFSPLKSVVKSPRAKSPRTSTEKKEKKTKKNSNKKLKYSPQISTEKQQDPIDEIMSICKESNIQTFKEIEIIAEKSFSTNPEKMLDIKLEADQEADQEKMIAEKIKSIYSKQPNKKTREAKKIIDPLPKDHEGVERGADNSLPKSPLVNEHQTDDFGILIEDQKEEENVDNFEKEEKTNENVTKQMSVFDFDDEADDGEGKIESPKLARLPRKSKSIKEADSLVVEPEEKDPNYLQVETEEKEQVETEAEDFRVFIV
jgi:hypothetical protein